MFAGSISRLRLCSDRNPRPLTDSQNPSSSPDPSGKVLLPESNPQLRCSQGAGIHSGNAEATALLNLRRRPGTYGGDSSRGGAAGPCGRTRRLHREGTGRLGGAAAVRCPLQSLFNQGPPPASTVDEGQTARSQLAAGAALQGLPQGPGHSVHVLPRCVAAHQADAQHLGAGRGEEVTSGRGLAATTEAGAEPAGIPQCGRRGRGCPRLRSLPALEKGVPFLLPWPSVGHWPRPGPGALTAAGPLPSPPRAQGRPQSRCCGGP